MTCIPFECRLPGVQVSHASSKGVTRLLGGCVAAYSVDSKLMEYTISKLGRC